MLRALEFERSYTAFALGIVTLGAEMRVAWRRCKSGAGALGAHGTPCNIARPGARAGERS